MQCTFVATCVAALDAAAGATCFSSCDSACNFDFRTRGAATVSAAHRAPSATAAMPLIRPKYINIFDVSIFFIDAGMITSESRIV